MKKIKLTEEEQEKANKLAELQRRHAMLKLEYDKEVADFWYLFQSRIGGGSFRFDPLKREVYELNAEETTKEKQAKGN